MLDRIVVTGGAGFIGANFIVWLRKQHPKLLIINIDKLTYSGNLANLSELQGDEYYKFYHDDIKDKTSMKAILECYQPQGILHLAAYSSVDLSIQNPEETIENNIMGGLGLLLAVKDYWQNLPTHQQSAFRFLYVNTDEVYGSVESGRRDTEQAFAPSNPYAASKAAVAHLVRAWLQTYNIPSIISVSSNNFGPKQHLEKFIPRMIHRAINGLSLPIYGSGLQRRAWLYVMDHCKVLWYLLHYAKVGSTHAVMGQYEESNLKVLRHICDSLNAKYPRPDGLDYWQQLEFCEDRAGHDFHYALDTSSLVKNWSEFQPIPFTQGLDLTVDYFLH